MEVTGISWSAFASGAFREGAIRGRKEAGCGGTTAQSWGGRRRAKPAAAAPQPIRGVEEGGPSVAGPQPMCGVVSGNTICGVCLKKKLFLKIAF